MGGWQLGRRDINPFYKARRKRPAEDEQKSKPAKEAPSASLFTGA